jgi:hypothetical protein
VGSTKVLPDDSVPQSLPWSSHSHSQRQQGQMSHSLGVRRHQCLISPNSGVVIDISRLGQSNNRVNEDVGSSLSSSSDGEFSVGSVHWVSGLESDNSPPREFVEVCSELGGGVYLSAMLVVVSIRRKLTS